MTQTIILAAGMGSRLRPLTDNKPKCMVALASKPLLHHQIEALKAAGVEQITIVTGYRADKLDPMDATTVHNPNHAGTNMIWSLECSRELWADGFLLAYSDIVYEPRLIKAILQPTTAPITVLIDREWRGYWEARFEDPLDDAETLRLNENGRILEIGAKTDDYQNIMGQFIGLVRFTAEGVGHLQNTLAKIEEEKRQTMHTTHLLQAMIAAQIPIQAKAVSRGWVEIDSRDDLALAETLCQTSQGRLLIPR